jgi:hypothetical protein
MTVNDAVADALIAIEPLGYRSFGDDAERFIDRLAALDFVIVPRVVISLTNPEMPLRRGIVR